MANDFVAIGFLQRDLGIFRRIRDINGLIQVLVHAATPEGGHRLMTSYRE